MMESVERKNTVGEAVNWYISERPKYENLAKKVESIIREVLNGRKLSYYSISSRAKDIESFKEKSRKDKYKDPKNEIKDLAGIRVITFVKSEVEACCKEITQLFSIDPDHSVDKTKELGNDKVGYRSVHYVAKLTEERLNLPEYKIFDGMVCEIQVRTILEHAWADISHDRNYKFQGKLPEDKDIERRFSLLAATLELVDREFNSIAKEIEDYAQTTEARISDGNLEIVINTTSLREYIEYKFRDMIESGELEAEFNGGESEIITELVDFGIETLSDLDELIGEDVIRYGKGGNFLGLVRNVMMLNDAERYFTKAWNSHWRGINLHTYELLNDNGVKIIDIINKYDITRLPY